MLAVCLQLITGKGAIGQLNLETSVPPFALKAGLLAIVGFNLVTALLPNATFSDENQKDVRKRPAGKTLELSDPNACWMLLVLIRES